MESMDKRSGLEPRKISTKTRLTSCIRAFLVCVVLTLSAAMVVSCTADTRYEELEARVSELESQREELQQQVDESTATIEELRSSIDDLSSRVDDIQMTVDDHESRIAYLER
jgi:peptidoglycan hydrolase CwlO-like protein